MILNLVSLILSISVKFEYKNKDEKNIFSCFKKPAHLKKDTLYNYKHCGIIYLNDADAMSTISYHAINFFLKNLILLDYFRL